MPTPMQSRKLMGEINVVPYIDVMLVLLVIFMVTAPLLTQGVKVELPKADAQPIQDTTDRQPLVLSVDAAGNLYLNRGDGKDEPTTSDRIIAVVGSIMKNSPDTPVFVKADRAVEIEESIYLSDVSGHRRTEQLVLHGRIRAQPHISWSFRRTSSGRGRRRTNASSDKTTAELLL